MNRDDFKCQICLSGEKTLHVHHMYYESGLKPWEYEGSSLITVCEDCHDKDHAAIEYFEDKDILELFNDQGIPAYFLRYILYRLKNNELSRIEILEFAYGLELAK